MELDNCTTEQLHALAALGFIDTIEKPVSLELARKILRDQKGYHITPEPSYTDKGCIYLCFYAQYGEGTVTTTTLLDEAKRSLDYDPPMAYPNYEDALKAGLDAVLVKLSPGKIRSLN